MNRMTAPVRGFSLLEVLLATTLLATGLTLALATLHAAQLSVERAERISAREEHLRAVSGFLRRRLSTALAVGFAQHPDSGRTLRFIGSPERMAFIAEMPPYLGQAGTSGPTLHEIALHHRPDGRAWLGIGLTSVPAGQPVADVSPRAPEVLVEDVRAFALRYRSRDLQGQPGEWSDAWEAVDSLPMQVEIAITTDEEWPLLRVSLPQGGRP